MIMIEAITELDTELLLAINGFRMPPLDQFFFLLSSKLVWIPFYAVILALVLRMYGWRSGLMIALGVGLAVCFADQACSSVIRPLVERMRPSNPLNPISPLVQLVNGYHGGRYGFPSCHAANTVAVAVFLSAVFRYRRLVVVTLLTWVVLNCYSRMYLGVHYPGDILVGALVGIVAGVAAYHLTIAVVRLIIHEKPEPSPYDAVCVNLCGSGIPGPVLLMSAGLATVVVLLGVSLFGYY